MRPSYAHQVTFSFLIRRSLQRNLNSFTSIISVLTLSHFHHHLSYLICQSLLHPLECFYLIINDFHLLIHYSYLLFVKLFLINLLGSINGQLLNLSKSQSMLLLHLTNCVNFSFINSYYFMTTNSLICVAI